MKIKKICKQCNGRGWLYTGNGGGETFACDECRGSKYSDEFEIDGKELADLIADQATLVSQELP